LPNRVPVAGSRLQRCSGSYKAVFATAWHVHRYHVGSAWSAAHAEVRRANAHASSVQLRTKAHKGSLSTAVRLRGARPGACGAVVLLSVVWIGPQGDLCAQRGPTDRICVIEFGCASACETRTFVRSSVLQPFELRVCAVPVRTGCARCVFYSRSARTLYCVCVCHGPAR